jgi:hypothetical protein
MGLVTNAIKGMNSGRKTTESMTTGNGKGAIRGIVKSTSINLGKEV